MQRAFCVATIAGVVTLGLYRPAPEVVVPYDAGICMALRVLAATALYDRLPRVDTPEEVAAVAELNADLARVRGQILEVCGD